MNMKKLKRNITAILFALFLLYISQFLDIKDIDSTKFNNQISSNNKNISNSFTKAYVSRIIDGDTIEVIIDENKYKVRLIGIDCPEYTSKIEYYGKEATEYTTSMLLDKDIYLEKDVSETDKYGRLLRYVWINVPRDSSAEEMTANMFNSILLENGYASQATYPPDVKYSTEFKEIAAKARDNNKGLWNK